MRPVLLITHSPVTFPLWKSLSETYDLCIVGGNPGLAQDMGLVGTFPLNQYANPDRNEIAVNTAYALSARLHSPSVSASLSGEIGLWANVDAPQLESKSVSQWWPAMVGEHIKQEVMLIEMLKGLMSERRVVGCVVHEDVTPDMRVMVKYCQTRGVKTIHVPHANCYYVGQQWDIHTESISDYIASSGSHMRGFYEQWGYIGVIRDAGSPSLDSWYTEPPSRSESRRVLGLSDTDFVLVYASTWGQLTSSRGGFEKEFETNIKMVLEYAKSEKATVVIKLHPGEAQGQEAFYMEKLKEFGVNGCVMRGYNEYVLRAGDVLCSHSPSNICVQAAICGMPSVYLPSEDFEFDHGPIQVGNDIRLAVEVAKGMTKDYWDQFVERMNCIHGTGQSATDNTVEFIKEICNGD